MLRNSLAGSVGATRGLAEIHLDTARLRGIRSAFLAEDFSDTAHIPYLIVAIGMVGTCRKRINTFRQRLEKDRAWVKRLVDALTAEGWAVWWDLKIRSGESFDRAIERTLRGVRAVVAVWSKNAVKSEWVRAESAWAKDQDIFVSVRIDDGARLPLKFYHVHTASLADWDGARDDTRFRRLVADIRMIAGPPRSPAQATSECRGTRDA
jgi:hypothetical protein